MVDGSFPTDQPGGTLYSVRSYVSDTLLNLSCSGSVAVAIAIAIAIAYNHTVTSLNSHSWSLPIYQNTTPVPLSVGKLSRLP